MLYLQGDRFSRYLPILFNWAQSALELPVPRVGTWEQTQLVRQIDLKSLYTDSACPIIVQTLLISADGQRLATATNRNTVQLWDAQTGRLVRTLVDKGTSQRATIPLAFSPDGQTLATADIDHSVKLWNANSGARIITLRGHTQPLLGLAFRPDGKTLATSTLLLLLVQSEPIPQPGITLWDVATGVPLQQIREVTQFQFSPDGQFLLANGQTVQLWEPDNNPSDRNLSP